MTGKYFRFEGDPVKVSKCDDSTIEYWRVERGPIRYGLTECGRKLAVFMLEAEEITPGEFEMLLRGSIGKQLEVVGE